MGSFLLNELTGGIFPKENLLDMEKVAIKIFSEQYPDDKMKGCYS